jgi:hypothetical protein
MKRYWISSSMIVAMLCFIVAATVRQETDTVAESSGTDDMHLALNADRTYIGAERCKTCHRKAEEGDQFGIWQNSKHAKAFETLGTPKAKEVAAKQGIDNPQTADACLKCHVTGHGVAAELLGPKYNAAEGVSCESCHGPGGDYYKKTTMTQISAGEIEGASVGLVTPDETVCVACHNEESPFYKEFKFEEMVAKIAHPIPES